MKNYDRANPQTQPFQWFLSFPAYRIFRRQNRGKIRYYEEAGNALFLQKPLPKVVVKAEQKLVVVLALLTVPTQRPQKQVVV